MTLRPETPDASGQTPTVVDSHNFDSDASIEARAPVSYRSILDVPTGLEPIRHPPRAPSVVPEDLKGTPTETTEKVAEKAADKTIVMPGTSADVAKETAAISPEGLPGDPKTGPRGLRLELIVAVLGVAAVSVGLGIWFSPAVGVVMFLIVGLFLLFNPVFGATLGRAKERKEVLLSHDPSHPSRLNQFGAESLTDARIPEAAQPAAAHTR